MNVVIIGAQWGDEGKGKIVDFLAADAQIVVRFLEALTLAILSFWAVSGLRYI